MSGSRRIASTPAPRTLRGLYWWLLAGLAAEFWAPRALLRDLHLGIHIAHAMVCLVFGMCFTEAYAFDTSEGAGSTPKIVLTTVANLVLITILEISKPVFGRHLGYAHYSVDAVAVIVGVLLLVNYHYFFEPRQRTSLATGSPGIGLGRAENRAGCFAPDAYIIGAQKAATTSLASLLRQHSELGVSDPKEPDFFTSRFDQGWEWYRSCFPRPARRLIDASTSYSMAPIEANPVPMLGASALVGVPHRIFSVRPDAKFIYMLRDPAARTLSAYWHSVRAGEERRPLRQALQEDREYTDPSYYFGQLAKYLEFFDLDRFLFIRFDDFVRNPLAEAGRCAKFLGVEDFAFRPEAPKNETFQYNALGTWVRDVIGTDRLEQISVAIRDLTPAWSHGRLRRILHKPYPRPSLEDYAWLSSRFQKDGEDFVRLTGLTITSSTAILRANARVINSS
jgi:hypothetical protein